MILRIRKMQKFWILTAVFVAVMLLLVPAIAFAEGDDSDTADSGSGSTELSTSDSSGAEEPSGSEETSGSDDSTTGLSSTDNEGDDSDTAGSTELSDSDSSDSEETSDSGDSTTELSSTDNEGDDSDTAGSTELSDSDSPDSEEQTGSEETSDSTTGLNSTNDDETEEVTFSDEDDLLSLDDGSTEIPGGEGNSYTAEITPDSELGTGEPTDFTVKFTEVGTSSLGSAQLIIPDEFTSISFSAGDISTSGDEDWTGELVGQVLSLWAIDHSNYLVKDGWVSAEFTATTSADSGSYTFQTSAWADNSVETIVGDPSSAIIPKVPLGTAESYAVLAGTTITNSGTTTVIGDIGLDPGDAITGYADVGNYIVHTGTLNVDNTAAEIAKSDLVTAYNYAATQPPSNVDNNYTDIEIDGLTLNPGVYKADSSMILPVGGTLELYADNPNDAFIFQIGSDLTIGSGSRILLSGQATFCQVFWQVTDSATIGTNANFVGHILAMQSISALSGAKIEGQLLAREAAVTLDSNTITNVPCTANVNNPDEGYDETLVVTVGTDDNGDDNGTDNGDDNGTGNGAGTETGTGDAAGTTLLDSQTDGDSDTLPGDTVALPETGGLALAQVLYALGGMMMVGGGIMLKRNVR